MTEIKKQIFTEALGVFGVILLVVGIFVFGYALGSKYGYVQPEDKQEIEEQIGNTINI